MTIYIDITQLEKQRVNTGIQRVVKEFLQRVILNTYSTNFVIMIYNTKIKKMQKLKNKDVKSFLNDIENFEFKNKKIIDIENIKNKNSIFFDMDSSWNAPYKREKLYPTLKKNGFKIYNLIYDLIPIVVPEFVQDKVVKNYIKYIKTVYKYSDLKKVANQRIKDDKVQLDIKGSRLGNKILEIEGLSKSFGDLNVLDNFTLSDKVNVQTKSLGKPIPYLNVTEGKNVVEREMETFAEVGVGVRL